VSKLRFRISISLDGYTAGPDQSRQNPLGVGGEGLHEWLFSLAAWRAPHGLEGGEVNESSRVMEEEQANIGATIMGRSMFGGGPGPWNSSQPWNGWWGDNPPYHGPVFVLTHHPRDPQPMDGGTTFHFVTDGIEAAFTRAREAAGDGDISIHGGATTVNQYLAAGLIDELRLHISPLTLGAGTRLFEGVPPLKLEQVKARAARLVTHVTYRVLP
jgi:dihydrofolate reductase